MQVKLITKNKEKTSYSFLVKDIEVSLLNAVRRSIISLVPTMAIENVEIRKNSSILYDETLSHRLGLIPLKTDLKHYEIIKKPEDEESLKCINKLTLKMKGPKVVYSKDFKSADPAIIPVEDKIPIVELLKGQEIQLEATAILGNGKEHMKWSPGIVFYKNKPSIDIKGDVDVEALKEMLPEDSALTISGKKVTVNDEKLYTTNYFDAFAGETIVKGVSVSVSDNEHIFNIESFGQLAPKDMLNESLDVLKEKLDEFNKQIASLK